MFTNKINKLEELQKYFSNSEPSEESVDKHETDDVDWFESGLWVPKEILSLAKISSTEKILLSIILALSKTKFGCIASDEYLGKICMMSRRRITYLVKSLIAKGILKKSKKGYHKHRKLEIDFEAKILC